MSKIIFQDEVKLWENVSIVTEKISSNLNILIPVDKLVSTSVLCNPNCTTKTWHITNNT